MYTLIKAIHVFTALISISGFCIRGTLVITQSPLAKHWLAKRLPHVVDTLLLLSASYLAYNSGQYPLDQNWINAKLLGLLAYIVLGMFALHWCKPTQTRVIAFVMAILTFCYIVLVATSRQPLPI